GDAPPIKARLPLEKFSDDQLKFVRELGKGNFGKVSLCKLKGVKKEIEVAVKELKLTGDITEEKSNEVRNEFILEMRIHDYIIRNMKGENYNIVGLIGVNFSNEKPMMIQEFIKGGSVDVYLKSLRSAGQTVQEIDVVAFATQVMKGVSYLSRIAVIHCDLACRNVMMSFQGDKINYKIGDFGLARKIMTPREKELNSSEYEGLPLVHKDIVLKLPIRWSSPEILNSFKSADSKSDTWGATMAIFEFAQNGVFPWPNCSSIKDAKQFLRKDFSSLTDTVNYSPKPDTISDKLFMILQQTVKNRAMRITSENLYTLLRTYVPGDASSVKYKDVN
ncbi:MAG: hypothetical protein MHPSP_003511, partial [Paramarteilia canceri]